MDEHVFEIRTPGRRPNTAVERLAYSTLIIIIDTLDAVAAALVRWPRPFDKKLEDMPVESDQWDDEEILRRFNEDSEDIEDTMSVAKIGNDTFVKATSCLCAPHVEASTIELVRTRTTIPIPRVRRRLKDKDGEIFVVMDYIPGERLDHVWPSLSLWSKLWVALTLRRYIRQLRQINSSVPGPLADSPQRCDGYVFRKRRGPFPDYASLSAFYNGRLDIVNNITYLDGHGNQIRCPNPDTEPFDDSRPLVFTHQDLSMRNIILGKDGKIWLVDWGMSGFYPWWFEYVSTVYAAERDIAPDSWNRLIPLFADPLFKHMRWMDRLQVALIAYT